MCHEIVWYHARCFHINQLYTLRIWCIKTVKPGERCGNTELLSIPILEVCPQCELDDTLTDSEKTESGTAAFSATARDTRDCCWTKLDPSPPCDACEDDLVNELEVLETFDKITF